MTRDRKAKQHARIQAAASGRRYTAARREQGEHPHGGGHPLTPARLARQDAPTFDERCYQLPWADVVLDGRIATDFWYPLPSDPRGLPAPGDGSGGSGVLHARLGADAQVTVTAHVLNLPATSPTLLTRVHYPDGLRLATVGPPLGTYRTSVGKAWTTYLARQPDGFARSFAPPAMYPHVSDRDRDRATRTATRVLRDAALDPYGWYAPGQPPDEEWPDGNGVTDLVQLASYGFRSNSDADATIGGLEDNFPNLLDAQDAGFSLDVAEDRAWVVAAFWFPAYHPDGWSDIARLRAEGWTVPALRVLHNRLSDARDKEQMERRRLDPFATDLTEETRLMWASGEADRWVSLAGSPAAASRLIEQGVTLDDLA